MENGHVDNVLTFANKASQEYSEIFRQAEIYEKRINSERTSWFAKIAFEIIVKACRAEQHRSGSERQNKKKRKIDDNLQDWSIEPILQKAKLKGFLQILEMLKQVHLSINQTQILGDPFDHAYKEASDFQKYLEKLDQCPVIKSAFGLCCTQYRTAKARSVACRGYECAYLIDVESNCYERYSPEGLKVTVCTACYTSKKYGQFVATRFKHHTRNELIRVDILKSEFVRRHVASNEEDEPTVTCAFCRKVHHSMCVMYDSYTWSVAYSKFCNKFDEIFRPIYVCQECMNELSHKMAKPQSENSFQFNPKDLQVSRLSKHMEETLKLSIPETLRSSMQLIVREVSRRKDVFVAKPNMLKVCIKNGRPFRWEYLQRSIMLFQERDKQYPIAVFNMIVYEYPSTNIVCLSYIDSVKLFQPAALRRGVFQNTILSYMDDARKRGYTKFHFWACPPKPGDEYIFYGRPEEKRSPCPNDGGLIRWYKEMLDKADKHGIIVDYVQVDEHTYSNYLDIPYLLDDFWPPKLEIVLSTYNKEVYDSTSAKVDRCQRSVVKSRKSASGGVLCVQERVSAVIRVECPGTLFCVNLKPTTHICTSDEELDIFCPYMGNRDNFIIECRDSRFDFSTTRRAQYSTLIMLSRIAKHSFNACCSSCNRTIKKGLYCYVCPNVVFCSKNCASIHPHRKYFRRFETPLGGKRVNPSPIYSQILKHVNAEATFLTSLAYNLYTPKSCSALKTTAGMVKQHLNLLHNAVHQQEQTNCRVCAAAYLAIIRHKEFCKGRVCYVPSCTQNMLFDNNGEISR